MKGREHFRMGLGNALDRYFSVFLNLLISFQHFVIRLFVFLWRAVGFGGPSCRFYPSCSEYALLCSKKYVPPKSILKIIWRILRCNPISRGGVDLP